MHKNAPPDRPLVVPDSVKVLADGLRFVLEEVGRRLKRLLGVIP